MTLKHIEQTPIIKHPTLKVLKDWLALYMELEGTDGKLSTNPEQMGKQLRYWRDQTIQGNEIVVFQFNNLISLFTQGANNEKITLIYG